MKVITDAQQEKYIFCLVSLMILLKRTSIMAWQPEGSDAVTTFKRFICLEV